VFEGEWEKGQKPYAVKVIEKLEKLNLVPLKLSDERLPIIARLYGYVLGDGNNKGNPISEMVKFDIYSETVDAPVNTYETFKWNGLYGTGTTPKP